MTGERVNNGLCPACGGGLERGTATIPYILSHDVIVIVKHVPAELCQECGESYTTGEVTDQVVAMLEQFKNLRSEVSIVSYSAAPVAAEALAV